MSQTAWEVGDTSPIGTSSKVRRNRGLLRATRRGLAPEFKQRGEMPVAIHDFTLVNSHHTTMTFTLGKRKRRDEVAKVAPVASKPKTRPEPEPESDNEDLQAIFRKAFEAKFKPLDGAGKKKVVEEVVEEQEQDEDENEDWSGLSDEEEDENAIEVVELKSFERANDKADKQQMKAFMVCCDNSRTRDIMAC